MSEKLNGSEYGQEYKQELVLIQKAMNEGNFGRVRVCARRLVGFAVIHLYGPKYGTDSLKILRTLSSSDFPIELQTLASMLLFGERDRLNGIKVSDFPFDEAQKIITLLERYNRGD